jgi:hypothetical protein
LWRDGAHTLERASKSEISRGLIRLIAEHYRTRQTGGQRHAAHV